MTPKERQERQEHRMQSIKKALEEGAKTRVTKDGHTEVYMGETGLGSMWLDIVTGEWR